MPELIRATETYTGVVEEVGSYPDCRPEARIRLDDGRLLVIGGTTDEMRSLAAMLFERVRVEVMGAWVDDDTVRADWSRVEVIDA